MERDELLRAVVQPLKWVDSTRRSSIGRSVVAHTISGFYEITTGWANGQTSAARHYIKQRYPDEYNAETTWHDAEDAAVAFLEADYRARIAEAIRLDLITGLVEALEDVHRHCQNSGIENATVGERVVERCEETALLALAAFRAAGGESPI
jgi:hypothetical protein